MKARLVDLEVSIHHWTDKAVLVSTDGVRDKAVWLPRSQIDIETWQGRTTITLPEQLATDKGLV